MILPYLSIAIPYTGRTETKSITLSLLITKNPLLEQKMDS